MSSTRSDALVFTAESTPFGWLGAAATERGARWVAFGADPVSLREQALRAFQHTSLIENAQTIEPLMAAIRLYLHAQSRTLDVPLDTRASAFCETVWKTLRRIPYGQTRSYTDIAAAIGMPRAVRAVANACAKNPLALITPCHRVIQKSGHLGGYRWGVSRKVALLAFEARSSGRRSVL
jgi:O-6-methylguanine DNA methyltransferase